MAVWCERECQFRVKVSPMLFGHPNQQLENDQSHLFRRTSTASLPVPDRDLARDSGSSGTYGTLFQVARSNKSPGFSQKYHAPSFGRLS